MAVLTGGSGASGPTLPAAATRSRHAEPVGAARAGGSTVAVGQRRPAPVDDGPARTVRVSRRGAIDAGSAADTAQQLGVLLEAGVAPSVAWRHLADAEDPVAAEVVATGDVASVLQSRGGAWRDLGAAWAVATTVGAPLADTLRGIAAALRENAETTDEVRVALAEPAATARLMSWLPLVGLVLGMALGFDTLRVAATNPVGIAALVAGAVLVVLARRWSAALVRRAQPDAATPGLDAELMAVAVSGGVSLARATAVCGAAGVTPTDGTERVLTLSRSAGAPAVELLRAAAALARHRARTEGRMRAARLSSRLLLPLGVCVLPAFLLLGVAPMLLSVLTSTSLTL